MNSAFPGCTYNSKTVKYTLCFAYAHNILSFMCKSLHEHTDNLEYPVEIHPQKEKYRVQGNCFILHVKLKQRLMIYK